MRVRLERTGAVLVLDEEPVGKGGEATVYAVPEMPGHVAKIYHRATPTHAAKLAAMIARAVSQDDGGGAHVAVAWPTERLFSADAGRAFVGYLMPRIPKALRLHQVYHPAMRQSAAPGFHFKYLLRTARNLAAAVRGVHAAGHVVGDLNESNVLVSATALVSLVDTDSFQITARPQAFRCPVGKMEYTPPELQGANLAGVDRRPEHDSFGLGVLTFQLLMQGVHPFGGVHSGETVLSGLGDWIAGGLWPYSLQRSGPFKPRPAAPPWDALPPQVQILFLRCFDDGHSTPERRPSASDWARGLGEAEKELKCCDVSRLHFHHQQADACPWCRMVKQLGRDPFPESAAVRATLPEPPPAVRRGPAQPPVQRGPAPTRPQGSAAPLRSPPRRRGAFGPWLAGVIFGLLYAGAAIVMVSPGMTTPFWQGPPPPAVAPPDSSRVAPSVLSAQAVNSMGMKFALIPAGEFMMGSAVDLDAAPDELPQHKVRIPRPFYLGVHSVTVKEFKMFVALTGYRTEAETSGKGGYGYNAANHAVDQQPQYTWRNNGFNQTDTHPVVNVSWNDAVAFCDWLSKGENKRYRLPTEAEFEYACRAGTTTRFNTGDSAASLNGRANVADQAFKAVMPGWPSEDWNDGFAFTSPVESFKPNAWGLYDVPGNVWVWCADWYGEHYYATSPAADPKGPATGADRVIRGGSWAREGRYARSACRSTCQPVPRSFKVGFRVLLEVAH